MNKMYNYISGLITHIYSTENEVIVLTENIKQIPKENIIQPILATTPVIATRLRKKIKGKLNLKENSVIFQTINTEYEIFFNQNFEKSKIIE